MYFRYYPKETKSERIVYVRDPSRGKKHFWGEYGKNYGFFTSEDQQKLKKYSSIDSNPTPSSKHIYKSFHNRTNTQPNQRFHSLQPQKSPQRPNRVSKKNYLKVEDNFKANKLIDSHSLNKQSINGKLNFQKSFDIKIQFPKIKNKIQIKPLVKNSQALKQKGKYAKKPNWNFHKEIKKNKKVSPTYQSSIDNTLVPLNFQFKIVDN